MFDPKINFSQLFNPIAQDCAVECSTHLQAIIHCFEKENLRTSYLTAQQTSNFFEKFEIMLLLLHRLLILQVPKVQTLPKKSTVSNPLWCFIGACEGKLALFGTCHSSVSPLKPAS
jgi:hypothetical protein